MPVTTEDRSEIAFFDVETTVPTRPGQGFSILEFGAILVCPRKLVELRSYSTLVRPVDLSHISTLSVRCNGITKDAVVSAPKFGDIADVVYDILHGRVWAGHNILRFDCARIREAFAEINRPAPEPKGTIDSLALLTQKFGRRAGDMKMASLATYFGLGEQTHRSLDDVRMNLEVLKYCATVLFLESSLPDIFPENSWISPNATTRSRSNRKNPREQTGQNEITPSSSVEVEYSPTPSPPNQLMEENHPIMSLMTPHAGEVNLPLLESNSATTNSSNMETEIESETLSEDSMEEENTSSTSKESLTSEGSNAFNMNAIRAEIENGTLPEDNMAEENSASASKESPTSVGYECSNGCNDFLKPDDISIPSISVALAPLYRGTQKIQILHQNFPLQLQCTCLKVRFGISSKFVDHAGRPRLSIVVNVPPILCNILDTANDLAQKLSVDSGSSSEWRPVVTRNPGFFNFPTVRLHLPTVADGEITRLGTEIHQKDGSATQKLVFSRLDVVELDSLFPPGNLVDAYFSVEAYDYQQNAGIRLVAKKLIIHSS